MTTSTSTASSPANYLTRQALSPTALLARSFATSAAWSPAVLRLTLATVLFPHGAQKAFGWFGGHGFDATMGFLTGSVGLPSFLAFFVIALEAFGPLLLLAGAMTRHVALAVIGLMIGAIATVHYPYGFFMNWSGGQAGEGFEYHLLVIGIALALVVSGGGAFSLDRRLTASNGSKDSRRN
jgi:putative oxidoreductase